jgi:hypothetical protein
MGLREDQEPGDVGRVTGEDHHVEYVIDQRRVAGAILERVK